MKNDWFVVACFTGVLVFATGCPMHGQRVEPAPADDAGVEDDTDDGSESQEPTPARIEFPADRFVVEVDSVGQPRAEVFDDEDELIEEDDLRWISADESIIEISSGGMAIGQQVGETELIATAGDIEERWPAEVVETAVADVTVVPEDAEMIVGQQLPYDVTLRDAANAPIDDERPVSWSIDDSTVATIDGDGVVEAVGEGTTEIIAVVEGVEGRADLTIHDVEVASVEIDAPPNLWLVVGESYQLDAHAFDVQGEPVTASVEEWSSSNPDVASVDPTGLVEAHDVGMVTITATVEESEDSTTVDVHFPVDDVTSGHDFSCAIGGDRPFCVGNNDDGQLGDGTGQSSNSFVEVQFDGKIETVSAGDSHACVVDTDGDVFCWGSNDEGQLDGSPGSAELEPVKVDVGEEFVDVSAGARHSCAVTADDTVFCWGANDERQLGSSDGAQTEPVEVEGTVGFVDVVAGGSHSCAIGTDGSGYCWGANDRKQLGGSTDAANSTTPQYVDGGYSFSSLSAGDDFTCGVDPGSGPPVCWGANDRGQFGNDETTDAGVPRVMALEPGESLLRVDAGRQHTCGIVTGGYLRCWGAHGDGRLGIDTGEDVTTPTEVDDDQNFDIVAAGVDHGCGLTPDDTVLCWGGPSWAGDGLTEVDFQW